MFLVDDWDVTVACECVKLNNYRSDIGHKCIQISSTKSDDKDNFSFFSSIDKSIDDHVSDSSNICNDYLKIPFKGLSGRQPKKNCRHRSCIIYFHLHPRLGMNHRKLAGKAFSLPASPFLNLCSCINLAFILSQRRFFCNRSINNLRKGSIFFNMCYQKIIG